MEMFKYSAEIGGNAHIAHISLSISDQVLIFLVLPNIRPKFARFATVFTSVPQKLPLPLISEEADIERGDSVLRALLKECIWNLSIQIRGVPRDHSKLETECWTALKRYSLQPPLYTTKLRATKIRRSLFNVSEKYTKNIVKLFPVICTPLFCSIFTLFLLSLCALYFFCRAINEGRTAYFSVFVVSLNVTTFCDVRGFLNSDPSFDDKESSRPLPIDGSLAEVLHHCYARIAFEVMFWLQYLRWLIFCCGHSSTRHKIHARTVCAVILYST